MDWFIFYRKHMNLNALKMIKHHHENCDGSGYPDGLSGDKIPLGSRIIAVADYYDKALNMKSGHEANIPNKVINDMVSLAGERFDPLILNCFVDMMKEVIKKEQELYETEISLYELREGMILAKPLETRSGRVMLGADFKITKDILERIWKHHLNDSLVTDVYIYKRSA
jgi:hypothetical protein